MAAIFQPLVPALSISSVQAESKSGRKRRKRRRRRGGGGGGGGGGNSQSGNSVSRD